jgi:uncharacterized protein rv1366/MT1412
MTINNLKDKPDFSKNSIIKLGKAIREGGEYNQDLLEEFRIWNSGVVEYCTQLERKHYANFPNIYCSLPLCLKKEITIPNIEFSSRVKTLDTLRQKLQRQNTSLDRIQDVAGTRIDGLLTLRSQKEIATSLACAFKENGAKKVECKNLLDSPRLGYRAVHLQIKSPAGWIEVQIRTHLQSAWANAYEALADVKGREIRYENESSPNLEGRPRYLIDISNILHNTQKKFDKIIDKIYEYESRDIFPPDTDIEYAITLHQGFTEVRERLDDYVDHLRSRTVE